MSFVEAFLLALALCVDTLVVSTTTAFHDKMSWHRGLLLAAILAFFQFAFPLLGALIGDVARSFIEAVDHWVAFGLLAFIGGKMILDGVSTHAHSYSPWRRVPFAPHLLQLWLLTDIAVRPNRTTSHESDWASLRCLSITKAGEDVEQRELSSTVSRNGRG